MKNPPTKTPKSQTQILFSQPPSMESFSLLNVLRRDDCVVPTGTTEEEALKIKELKSEENGDVGDDDDDEGPFFDLKFTVPVEEDVDNGAQEHDEESDFGEEEDDGRKDIEESSGTDDGDERDDDELNFTDPNLSLSPSDELFFKGSFIQLESSSSSSLGLNNSSPNSKSHQFPAVSFLKSATKFRVFMLGFKKPKSSSTTEKKSQTQTQTKQQQKKFLTVKLKVEEVPIISLFTKENSSRNKNNNKERFDEIASSDEKKLAKYLKMIKQGSKRYGEKMKFSGNLGKISSPTTVIPSSSSFSPSKKKNAGNSEDLMIKSQKQGKISSPTTGFRVVCKHLGKSRSASSSSSSSAAVAPSTVVQSRRQDDSLLQQEDGIQSAILHCKRSFNSSSSRDSSSLLSRSTSDPTHEKSSIDLLRKSQSIAEERKGTRI